MKNAAKTNFHISAFRERTDYLNNHPLTGFIGMTNPPMHQRAAVAAKAIAREYSDLKEKGQEEARKIMRKKKGLLDASDIGGLPEGFEGNVGDLFAAWGAPTELTEAERLQKEKDEQEKAEKLAKEKEVRCVSERFDLFAEI